MENSHTTGKVIGALLVGAAIGSVLGILFAPHKGSKTRKNIANSSDDLAHAIKDKFEDMFEEVKSTFQAQKEKAADFVADKTKA
ncbi:MAG: YtxH domain-containing protein [Sphingobacteriaceae bacterium]|jgi:gas vesicle protein|nr:YtxH domain-containing protein [Sphingobacteriaceae bacterium]